MNSSLGIDQTMIQVQLEIVNQDGTDPLDLPANSSLSHYLSFGIQDDLYLGIASDTIACSHSHFERDFGVSPKAKILAYFSVAELHDDPALIVKENAFEIGPLEHHFSLGDIHDIPTILNN